MNKTYKLIPELRFPEFKNEGKWEEKVLGEVCGITNGKANVQDHVENGKYPLFDRSEVIKASNDFIIDSEAVIIPGEGMRFIPKYYEGKFNLHQRAYALKDFICSGQFVYYSMLHRSTLLSQKAVQSTVLSLRLPILQNFPIEIPKNPKEQHKIAACLSSLDEVLTAHSQKLDLLKDHKKGLMQNLFPQEGEKVPKYRFKEFKEEWVEKKLGNIAPFVNEKTSLENLSLDTYISTENLLSDYSGVTSASKLPTTGNFTKYKQGDVLISNIRPYLKKVWFADKEGACSNDVFAVRARPEMNEVFLSFFLKNDRFINYVMIGAKGVKMPRGDKDLISEYLISYPKGKLEQQKIASCLSTLDEIITAQAQKVEQLKQHKKGLMQGLFPKID